MANYKRRKCRYLGRIRRNSETFKRSRLGLKPIIVPDFTRPADVPLSEWWPRWRMWWDHHRRIYWPADTGSRYLRKSPMSWDILYHNRPRRAAEKRMQSAILCGKIDPDDAAWPLAKKPHTYFW